MKRYIVRPQNGPSESPEGNFVLHADHEAALRDAVAKERAWWIAHTDAVHSKISEMLRSARGAAHD